MKTEQIKEAIKATSWLKEKYERADKESFEVFETIKQALEALKEVGEV